jgi:hypothetical protein
MPVLDSVHGADFQVLHLLLFRLLKKEYDEKLLEFLAVDEHLVDVGDDLVDYEVRLLAVAFWQYTASFAQSASVGKFYFVTTGFHSQLVVA